MTKISKLLLLTMLCFSVSGINTVVAQTLKLNPKGSSITISGTTNVHDWKSKVTLMTGELTLNGDKKVQSLTVEIPVKSIKSDEKLMDTKTYEAFNSAKNPSITFKLTDVNTLQINGNDIAVTITGNLTMAGTTRKIVLKSTGKNTKAGTYEFKGNINLKMSDFGMKAPTALMGVMKVGDVVNLSFVADFEGNPDLKNLSQL